MVRDWPIELRWSVPYSSTPKNLASEQLSGEIQALAKLFSGQEAINMTLYCADGRDGLKFIVNLEVGMQQSTTRRTI